MKFQVQISFIFSKTIAITTSTHIDHLLIRSLLCFFFCKVTEFFTFIIIIIFFNFETRWIYEYMYWCGLLFHQRVFHKFACTWNLIFSIEFQHSYVLEKNTFLAMSLLGTYLWYWKNNIYIFWFNLIFANSQ